MQCCRWRVLKLHSSLWARIYLIPAPSKVLNTVTRIYTAITEVFQAVWIHWQRKSMLRLLLKIATRRTWPWGCSIRWGWLPCNTNTQLGKWIEVVISNSSTSAVSVVTVVLQWSQHLLCYSDHSLVVLKPSLPLHQNTLQESPSTRYQHRYR